MATTYKPSQGRSSHWLRSRIALIPYDYCLNRAFGNGVLLSIWKTIGMLFGFSSYISPMIWRWGKPDEYWIVPRWWFLPIQSRKLTVKAEKWEIVKPSAFSETVAAMEAGNAGAGHPA